MIVTIIAGIITGFVVSVPPLGPIAFALISKGFRGEKKEGMAIAAGSAFMDMLYALIAFGGISLFISFLPLSAEEFIKNNSYTIQIVLIYAGCAAVVYYGIKIMRSKDDFEKMEAKESEHLSAVQGRAAGFVKKHKMPLPDKSNFFGLFVMGVMLCISSITLPASWVLLVGYVKGFGVIDQSFWGGLLFSVGAFLGTILWFWLLLKAITIFKHKINRHTIGKLNIIAGIILLILGVFLFAKATGTLFNIFLISG